LCYLTHNQVHQIESFRWTSKCPISLLRKNPRWVPLKTRRFQRNVTEVLTDESTSSMASWTRNRSHC
jgi:hypothetical protein